MELWEEGDDDGEAAQVKEVSEGARLKINKSFAKHYETKKRRIEIRDLEKMAADQDLGSSDDELEDEDGDALDPVLDTQIFKTISLIRKRDPRIYDATVAFFDHRDDQGDVEAADPGLKKRYKDVIREQLLAQGPGMDDDDGVTADPRNLVPENSALLAYDNEQKQIREAFLSAGETLEDDATDGELLTVREKSKQEVDAEELQVQEAIKEMSSLRRGHELGDDDSEADAFLTEYMLKKKWTEKDDLDWEGSADDEDEEDIEKAENFESAYNFRFEEDGGVQIQSYARNMQDTVRKQDDTRKKQRQALKERKEKELVQKQEELKRLKNLKREEIKRKLQDLAKQSGGAVFDEELLEEDWDEDKFEQKMKQAFDNDFYEQEDPEWREDEDIHAEGWYDEDGEWWQGADDYGEVEMAEGEQLEHDIQDQETQAKYHAEKAKLLDEVYQLDYEDIIAGMPTRFKYRQVEPQDYGLSTQDILLADDRDLKQYVSLKALAPFKTGRMLVHPRKRRRLRQSIKDAIRQLDQQPDTNSNEEAVHEEAANPATEDSSINASRKKRSRKRNKAGKAAVSDSVKVSPASVSAPEAAGVALPSTRSAPAKSNGKKSKDRKQSKSNPRAKFGKGGVPVSRLQSYGF